MLPWTTTLTGVPRHQLYKQLERVQLPYELEQEELMNTMIPTTMTRRGVRCCQLLEAELEEERLRRQLCREQEKKQLISELVRKHHQGLFLKEELPQQLRQLEKELNKKWQCEEEECMQLEKQIMEQHRINKFAQHHLMPVNPIKLVEQQQELKHFIKEEQQQCQPEHIRRRHHELRRKIGQIEREVREICQQQQYEKLFF